MAITKAMLDEPLLTKQHLVLCRDIARAAQLNEALSAMDRIVISVLPSSVASGDAKTLGEIDYTKRIQCYLKAEIMRVLMQIKLPTSSAIKAKDTAIIATVKP